MSVKNIYEIPAVERFDIAVERGFAQSGIIELPDVDIIDGGDY